MKIKTLIRRFFLGILFILPFLALFLLLEKLWHKFSDLSGKVEIVVGENKILGPYTVSLILILLMLVILYLAGYLTDYNISSKIHDVIERSFLGYIPGYLVYKNKMSTTLEATSGERIPVYFINESEKKPAILIEKTEKEVLLFIPGIPDTNSGELVITAKENVELANMGYHEFLKSLQLSGRGLLKNKKPLP